MKIIGNTVGTNIPKPDWLQDNPKKGDYIKNKEKALENAVLTTAQELTEDQKAQARQNIGAKSENEIIELIQKNAPMIQSNAPDWNADEGKAGHIENRTHYVKLLAETLEGTHSFSLNNSGAHTDLLYYSDIFEFELSEEPSLYSIDLFGYSYTDLRFGQVVTDKSGTGIKFAADAYKTNTGYRIRMFFSKYVLDGEPAVFTNVCKVKELDAKYLPMDDISTLIDTKLAGGSGGSSDSSQNANGLTKAQINALDGMFKIVAFSADPTAAYTAFKTAFGITDSGEEEPDEPVTPEVTLSSISATYTGGDVAVGTAVADLTGIVVTAHYSDGTSQTVTGYTLSGEIAEGSNTITVSYGGKTTTITVTGVVEEDPLYGRFWPPKGKILDWNVPQWDDVDNFAYTSNINGTQSEYEKAGLPGGAFIRLDKLQGTVYIRVLTNNQYGIMGQGVYQVYANSDGEIATGGFAKITPTIYRQFGGKTQTMDVDGTTYYFMMFKFEIPAGQTGYFISTATALANGYFISTDKTGIDDAYKPYYTLFGSDPSDRITEPATEVA